MMIFGQIKTIGEKKLSAKDQFENMSMAIGSTYTIYEEQKQQYIQLKCIILISFDTVLMQIK